MDKHMDERQHLVRGKIFKHACFFMIGLLFLESLLQSFFEITFFEGAWSKLFILIVAVTAMTAEMVWRDAYPLSERMRIVLSSVIGIAGIAGLVLSIIDFASGQMPFVAFDALSETAAMLFISIILMFTSAVFALKFIKDKKARKYN